MSKPQEWLTMASGASNAHPGVVNALMRRELDGLLIKGVFSPGEVNRALEHLADTDTDAWTEETFGAMLGMPLNQLGDRATTRKPYLDDTDLCRPIYVDAFGFDPHERIVSVVEPMAGDLRCRPPDEGGRSYNPGNIRRYDHGKGGLRPHVGNEFVETSAPGAMSHLLTTTTTRDHMSYFVVLQRPSGGGCLSVFDLLFTEHPIHERRFDGEYRDDAYFDTLPCRSLDPGPGDMILFGGGWRWHRVDPVVGPTPRYTYGGFASPSRDDRYIHFWC